MQFTKIKYFGDLNIYFIYTFGNGQQFFMVLVAMEIGTDGRTGSTGFKRGPTKSEQRNYGPMISRMQ